MNIRTVISVCAVLLLSLAAMAQTKAPELKKQTVASDFPARLEASANQVQTQISTLEAQLTSASVEQRETIEHQIVGLKHQGEIDRLQILLDWARVQGDANRIDEIQRALTQWQTPPQPQHAPEISKDANSPRASNDKVPVTTDNK